MVAHDETSWCVPWKAIFMECPRWCYKIGFIQYHEITKKPFFMWKDIDRNGVLHKTTWRLMYMRWLYMQVLLGNE